MQFTELWDSPCSTERCSNATWLTGPGCSPWALNGDPRPARPAVTFSVLSVCRVGPTTRKAGAVSGASTDGGAAATLVAGSSHAVAANRHRAWRCCPYLRKASLLPLSCPLALGVCPPAPPGAWRQPQRLARLHRNQTPRHVPPDPYVYTPGRDDVQTAIRLEPARCARSGAPTPTSLPERPCHVIRGNEDTRYEKRTAPQAVLLHDRSTQSTRNVVRMNYVIRPTLCGAAPSALSSAAKGPTT